MVKIIFFFVILLVLTNCTISNDNRNNKKFNIQRNGEIFSQIDTSSIYILTEVDNKDYIINSKLDMVKLINIKQFLKFYKNGRVALFNNTNTDDVYYLNPNKAIKGFYYIESNTYKMEFIFNHVQAGKFLSKKDLIIKGDTIISYTIRTPRGGGYYSKYIKQKIPKDSLIYKPDW